MTKERRALLDQVWLEAFMLREQQRPPVSRFIRSQRERLLMAIGAYRSHGTGIN